MPALFLFCTHTLFTDSQKCYSTIRPPVFDEMRKAESQQPSGTYLWPALLRQRARSPKSAVWIFTSSVTQPCNLPLSACLVFPGCVLWTSLDQCLLVSCLLTVWFCDLTLDCHLLGKWCCQEVVGGVQLPRRCDAVVVKTFDVTEAWDKRAVWCVQCNVNSTHGLLCAELESQCPINRTWLKPKPGIHKCFELWGVRYSDPDTTLDLSLYLKKLTVKSTSMKVLLDSSSCECYRWTVPNIAVRFEFLLQMSSIIKK